MLKDQTPFVALARALILIVLDTLALPVTAEEWVDRSTNITCETGNFYFAGRWAPATGLHVRVSTPDKTQSVVIEIADKEGKLVLTPAKAFSPSVIDGSQFNLAALPSNTLANAELVLKFRQEVWALYVESRPVAVFPAPFLPPASVAQPTGELPPADKREVRLQPTGEVTFHDDFLVDEAVEDSAKLTQWDQLSGTWLLHTAGDSAVERDYIKADARKTLKPAFSANFYSLKGQGTNAVIATGYKFDDSYSLQAAVQVKPGEMGLVFCLQDGGPYHAFTLRLPEDSDEAVLALWKTPSSNATPREILGAVTTTLVHGQWVMLKIRTFQNRIQCFMDNVKVLDTPAEMPVGGRYGLYVTSDAGIRFDDVTAESNHDLDFLALADIRRHVLIEHGSFFPKRRFFSLFPPRELTTYLKPDESDQPQWLVVGSMAHGGHVFSATFTPERSGKPWCAGLVAGYQGTNQPHLRFTCRRAGNEEEFLLENVTPGGSDVLEKIALAIPGARDRSRPVTLMCDATNEKELRLYRDDEMVLIHHLSLPTRGASGVYIGPKTAVRVSNLSYEFQRENVYGSKFVTNKTYIEDPFMRHWSSPEGQWLELTNGMAWHQGDFFGRFDIRLPYVAGAEAHIGIEEGQTNGAYVVTLDAAAVNLLRGPDFRHERPLATAATNLFCKPAPATNFVTLHNEGYWLWLTGGDRVLLKQPLKQPLKGRQVRLNGFTTDQLKLTRVERYNTVDYLFNESLYEWVINGGQWEVVNRFQCDPRWSHMDGESTNGLAALWTKYLFKGDFCMELYAGMRMGWYERCGDLNVTIMNPRTTPSEGYTATCTGWDPDQSQLYTRLYRNGDIIAESEKYLAPRNREGNKRLGFIPLVKLGGMRDVHGAWYYMKLRRIGKHLEYYFDNELVFATDDPNPIAEGSAGIWTYLNSMVVARVKIAAEGIRPKPFPFSSTLVMLPSTRLSDPSEGLTQYADILNSGRPLENMLPPNWEMDDTVGHSRLTWREEAGTSPYFAAENVLGSGSMLVRCKLPPVPYADLAGWRFLVKRTTGAEFNFHYSVGRKKDGVYHPERQFFHRISGPGFSLGPFKMSGESKVPAVPATNTDWCAAGAWTLVEVWPATDGLRDAVKDSNVLVRVEGFGNLQQSYEAQGLTGNAPGDGYAVRDFSEIRFALPTLALATNLPAPKAVSLLEAGTGKPLVTATNLAGVQAWIDRTSTNGVIQPTLVVERAGGRSRQTLAWLTLPDTPAYSCAWDTERPNAVILESRAGFPDRRFSMALLSSGNVLAPLTDAAPGRRFALLPRRFDFCEATVSNIPIMVAMDGKTSTFSLPWQDNHLQEPPVLLKIEGLTPLYEGFERRELIAPLVGDGARMRIRPFDPEQGSYLQVFNTERNQRLRSALNTTYTLSRYPVFQFRYRGTNMVSVSLSLGDAYYARLNEENGNARQVRDAKPLVLDNRWHTWMGVVSDTMNERPFDARLMAIPSVILASYNGIDQTGRYTQWDLDDIAVGPAVSSREQLAFTPCYFDFTGVQTVFMAVRGGGESYFDLTPDQVHDLRWREILNMSKAAPDIDGLRPGFCHLFLKARDKRGNESRVTDLPFYLDREPLVATFACETNNDVLSNGPQLRVNFANPGNGAPLDLDNAKVRWETNDVTVPALCSSFNHTPDRDTIVLNWPYIFRDQLNQSHDGQAFKLILANIQDGAGNGAPDVVVPMTIDYAKDKRPPTPLQTTYPTNILWTTPWEFPAENNLFFASGPNIVSTTLVRGSNESPYLCSVVTTNGGTIWHSFESAPWPVMAYPYLSFRIRRPDMSTNDTTRIDMELEPMQNPTNVLALSLTHTATGTAAVVLSEPLVWQSNTWYSLTFDIPQLLKDKYTTDQLKEMKIKHLKLVRSGNTTTNTLHVQSFFVFAPWKPVDAVKLNAYDASGMEGNVSTNEFAEKNMTLVPASLPVADRETGWVALAARDRAGNDTQPVWVPLFSTNTPPPAATPPVEKTP